MEEESRREEKAVQKRRNLVSVKRYMIIIMNLVLWPVTFF